MRSISCTIALLLLYIQRNYGEGSNFLPNTEEAEQWSFHRKLYDYKEYGDFTMTRIIIPTHTVELNLTFNVYSHNRDCKVRTVKIFANPDGLPVVNRDGESFPDDAYISDFPTLNITVASDNKTVNWSLGNLQKGHLFVMAVMPRVDTRIKQQGLGHECEYFLKVKSSLNYIPQQNLPSLLQDTTSTVTVDPNKHKLYSFRVPFDSHSFSLEVHGCTKEPCGVNISVWETLNSNLWEEPALNCHWNNTNCTVQVSSPLVNTDYYIGLVSTTKDIHKLSLTVIPSYCKSSLVSYTRHRAPSLDPSCHLLYHLGRETPVVAEEGSNMYDHFVRWDHDNGPHSTVDVKARDHIMSVMGMALLISDTGATLKVTLTLPEQKLPTSANISLCVSPLRIPKSMACMGGALLQLSSQQEKDKTHVLIPFPQGGHWYIALNSLCFNSKQSDNKIVECKVYPEVNITVHLTPCVDGGCGKYGSCKLYFGSNLLYSSCSCYSGWHGYGCNDGHRADSDADVKVGVYLLTLSNLSFMPGIMLALYRRHYVEAMAYAYNMFFSTFYHACDTSKIYQLCIMPYNVLSFADFFASLLSFWVTLLVIARISQVLRSFCHVIGMLFISVAVVYNRHGLFEQVLPIACGVALVFVSWGRETYKRRTLFPPKRRMLLSILPGVILAILGLIFNLALETEKNYKYMHSVWHLFVSASIVFLLPPRRSDSRKSGPGLSIQSGDISSIDVLSDDQLQANIHRADETGETSEPSSPRGNGRGLSIRLTARERRGRNLVL